MTPAEIKAEILAAGVASFLKSLPYMAPEMIGPQADRKLREPLTTFRVARNASS